MSLGWLSSPWKKTPWWRGGPFYQRGNSQGQMRSSVSDNCCSLDGWGCAFHGFWPRDSVPWGGGCKGGARGKPRPCLSSGRKEQFWQQNLQCGAAFAASGHSHLLWLAAVSAMQNIFICRYFSALLAWPTEYLSSGLIPGFLQGFKRNCYWLNSGVIYNGNPVSHSSCPPRKSWALNLNLGESEAQFALFSFQDIGLFCEELKVPLKIKVSCVPMSWPI